MSKFDYFFESPVDPKLNTQILKSAEAELKINRASRIRSRWVMFFAPATAILAAVLVFKLTSNRETQFLAKNVEQIELVSDLMENDEVIDMVEDLTLLQELEYIEQVEVDDV